MKKKLFEIKSDCLDIVKRIKAIDKDYFVVYDASKDNFQLHHRKQKMTYCLTFPFDRLDERAVFYTLKTRVQNCEDLIKYLDFYNSQKEEANYKKILNNFKEAVHDSFIDNKNSL